MYAGLNLYTQSAWSSTSELSIILTPRSKYVQAMFFYGEGGQTSKRLICNVESFAYTLPASKIRSFGRERGGGVKKRMGRLEEEEGGGSGP